MGYLQKKQKVKIRFARLSAALLSMVGNLTGRRPAVIHGFQKPIPAITEYLFQMQWERHVSNALKIVEYLAAYPQVEAVHHPSLAGEPSHELYKKYLPNGSEVY